VDLFVHSEQIKFSDSFADERAICPELPTYFLILELAVQPSTRVFASLERLAGSPGLRSYASQDFSFG
jgi:hypothetical protein